MRRAVCPGSFDPVTNGHLDIVERAAKLFDEVVVAVGVNKSKSRLFTAEERIGMLTEACGRWDNVRVDGFTGLLTDFCLAQDIQAIVKGRLSAPVPAEEADPRRLGLLMAGVWEAQDAA